MGLLKDEELLTAIKDLASKFSAGEKTLYNKSAIYGSIKDAITAPKRAYEGKIDPYSPEGILEAMNLAGAAGSGGISAGAVTKAGGPGTLGIFGGAGRQDLVLSRGMDVTSLLSRLINSKNYLKQGPAREKVIEDNMRIRGRTPVQNYNKDVPTLRAPSLAIHHTDKPNQFDQGVTLVMRPDKFDPANTARSKLYNRDVYTKRSDADDFFRKEWHGKPAAIDPRMTERLDYDLSAMDEWIQGLASPKFNSFAEFEASRKGAGTLDTYRDISFGSKNKSRAALKMALIRDLQRNDANLDVPYHQLDLLDYPSLLRNLEFYKQQASSGSLGDTSKRVIEAASKMPSGYAELKYSGNVPMDAENLLGIILREQDPKLHKAISSGFPGVPVMSGSGVAGNQYMLDLLAEQIQRGRVTR